MDVSAGLIVLVVVLVLGLLFLFAAVKIAREYERGVIFRLGRLLPEPKGPGLFLLIPIVDRMVKVDLRTVTLNVPPQEVITKDNVPVRVNAVAYFRIVDPNNAIIQVENYMVATSQIAQTTLRSVLGQHVLDELLSERDKINAILQAIIDEATSPWGIKVSVVEVKDVEIPAGMQRAMARQAEAERERRAKVISAEGEYQASERLKDAAAVMSQEPITVQLRYLQTLLEIGASNNSTIVFPIPIDLLTALKNAADAGEQLAQAGGSSSATSGSASVSPPRRERHRDVGVHVGVVVRADDRSERRDLLALAKAHDDHALRGAAGAADPVDRDLDHGAAVGDEHHLVAVANDPRAREAALAFGQLRGLHAHRPAALHRVVADARPLAVAVLGDDEEVRVVDGDVDLDHLVIPRGASFRRRLTCRGPSPAPASRGSEPPARAARP